MTALAIVRNPQLAPERSRLDSGQHAPHTSIIRESLSLVSAVKDCIAVTLGGKANNLMYPTKDIPDWQTFTHKSHPDAARYQSLGYMSEKIHELITGIGLAHDRESKHGRAGEQLRLSKGLVVLEIEHASVQKPSIAEWLLSFFGKKPESHHSVLKLHIIPPVEIEHLGAEAKRSDARRFFVSLAMLVPDSKINPIREAFTYGEGARGALMGLLNNFESYGAAQKSVGLLLNGIFDPLVAAESGKGEPWNRASIAARSATLDKFTCLDASNLHFKSTLELTLAHSLGKN